MSHAAIREDPYIGMTQGCRLCRCMSRGHRSPGWRRSGNQTYWWRKTNQLTGNHPLIGPPLDSNEATSAVDKSYRRVYYRADGCAQSWTVMTILVIGYVKSRSDEIGCWDYRWALNFHRCRGSGTAEAPVKLQSDRLTQNPYRGLRDLVRFGDNTIWLAVNKGPRL